VKQRWVDAFNVIHKMPDLAHLAAEDNEACRRLFLSLLAPLVFKSGERWTVVFDAPRSGRSSAPGPITVIYAPHADTWIVNQLENERHADAITVVSSDEKDIGRRARALGATVVPSSALVRALRGGNAPAPTPDESEKPESVSADEVDYWLDAFGGGASGEPKERFDSIEEPPEEEERDL